MKMYTSAVFAVVVLSFFTACGDSESTSTLPAKVEGIFIDSAVSGLDYNCSSGASGVTDASGAYSCTEGDTLIFSIGGYKLGTCITAAVVNPFSLYPNDMNAALNIAQLLQTLDSDGDPGNGITPDENLVGLLSGITVSPTDASFETVMDGVLGQALVAESVAFDHLLETLASNNIVFTHELVEGKTIYFHAMEGDAEIFESWTFDANTLTGSTFVIENNETFHEGWTDTFELNAEGQIVLTDLDDPGIMESFSLLSVTDEKWIVLSEVIGGLEDDVETIEFSLDKPDDFPLQVQFSTELLAGKTVYLHDVKNGVEVYETWSFGNTMISVKQYAVRNGEINLDPSLWGDRLRINENGQIVTYGGSSTIYIALLGITDTSWKVQYKVVDENENVTIDVYDFMLNMPDDFPTGEKFTHDLINGKTVYYHAQENDIDFYETWTFNESTIDGHSYEVLNGSVIIDEAWSVSFELNADSEIVIYDEESGDTEYFGLISTTDTLWKVQSTVVMNTGVQDIASIFFWLEKPDGFPQ